MQFALERTPKIRKRLFTDAEIAYCEKYRFAERHYAGRWAAKEAVTKPLGCGLIQWDGVEVVRRRRSAPTVRISGKIKKFADAVGVREQDLYISITHSELSAVAVCVVRRERISGWRPTAHRRCPAQAQRRRISASQAAC